MATQCPTQVGSCLTILYHTSCQVGRCLTIYCLPHSELWIPGRLARVSDSRDVRNWTRGLLNEKHVLYYWAHVLHRVPIEPANHLSSHVWWQPSYAHLPSHENYLLFHQAVPMRSNEVEPQTMSSEAARALASTPCMMLASAADFGGEDLGCPSPHVYSPPQL